MAKLYVDSINKNNLFDYRILKRKANTLFVYLRNMNAPVLEDKEMEESGSVSDLVTFLDDSSAKDILSVVVPNFPSTYLETVNEIYTSIHLPRGVLNCMIIKTLRDKGGDLPGILYFKKVAESWINDNVLSTTDAVKYLTTVKEKVSTKNANSSWSSKSLEDINAGWEEL